MMNLAQQTGSQLIKMIQQGETTCAAVMESVLDSIGHREPQIQAFISLRPREELLHLAEYQDKKRQQGKPTGPLAGLPIAIKDNICTNNLRTTCASKMLANFHPPYNATVVELIEKADGIIIGKTNMDEFALGSTTENSAMQITRNPWNTDYVPGGTSGGSAAAVAAHETIFAIGSDTGGSIRQPASFCGVVGLKPTYGRISRYGLIAHASSLDQIGPITKSVEDASLLFSVMAQHDPKDSTSLSNPGNESIPASLRIGVPKEFFSSGLDSEVKNILETTIKDLEKLGIQFVQISLPHTEYAVPVYYIIACAELSSNLARFDGCRYGHRAKVEEGIVEMMSKTRTEAFGPEVKRRILLGAYVLSSGYYDAYYLRATKVRNLIRQDYTKAFTQCDAIIHPVAPTPPFKIGEKTKDPLSMYLVDIYSVIANLTGLPAISVPAGFSSNRLPVGMQLIGPALSEHTLLHIAGKIEANTKLAS